MKKKYIPYILLFLVAVYLAYLAHQHHVTAIKYISDFVVDPKNSHLLSPLAILVSAIGAWLFAFMSIRGSAATSRRKSTFDYLSKLSWDKDYLDAQKTFVKVKVGPTKIRQVAHDYEELKKKNNANGGVDLSEADQETISNYTAIKNILNEYEAIAVAIKAKALDEKMVRNNIRQTFVDHVDACREFIEETRGFSRFKEPQRIWMELQKLAKKWSS